MIDSAFCIGGRVEMGSAMEEVSLQVRRSAYGRSTNVGPIGQLDLEALYLSASRPSSAI